MDLARVASIRAAKAVSLEKNLSSRSIDSFINDYETTLSFLRSIPLFHHLSEEQLRRSVRLLETIDIDQGEKILTQSDLVLKDDVFFILVEGEASVYIRSVSSLRAGYGVRVGALTPGDVFGHEAFISQSTLRGATVLASTECTCLAGDRQLLLEIVASVPQSVRRGILTHFSDLRNENTASLSTYVHEIRDVIQNVGAEVLKFELEQEQLIRQTKSTSDINGFSHARTSSSVVVAEQNILTVAKDDWNTLMNSTNETSKSAILKASNENQHSTTSHVSNVFTERHVVLLRKMVNTKVDTKEDTKEDTSKRSAKKDTTINDKSIVSTVSCPRRARLLDVNRLILQECLAHTQRINEIDQHHLISLAQEAKNRKKQGSDAAKLHIAGSYVPELSATDMLSVVMQNIASLCDAEGIAIFVGLQSNDPLEKNNKNKKYQRSERPASPSVSRGSTSSFNFVQTSDDVINHIDSIQSNNKWKLLIGFDRHSSRFGTKNYYAPSGKPGPRFRKRIGSQVLNKDSVEIETLGSGREVMVMSIRNLHTPLPTKKVASTHRRRGSITGNVGVQGYGKGSGNGTDMNSSDATWDTAVVQLIRAEPFSSGDEQVLQAARESLHGSLWQNKLENLEEYLATPGTYNLALESKELNTVDGRSTASSSSSVASSLSSHQIHRSLQMRVQQLSGLPYDLVSVNHSKVGRSKTPKKVSESNTRTVIIRAQVYHGTTAISSASCTTFQLPFLQEDLDRQTNDSNDSNDLNESNETKKHSSSLNVPTQQNLFMLDSNSSASEGDESSRDTMTPLVSSRPKSGSFTTNKRGSVVSQTPTVIANQKMNEEDKKGPPPFVGVTFFDWLEFQNLHIKDIPRGAKVVFEVLTTEDIDSKKDSKDARETKNHSSDKNQDQDTNERRMGWKKQRRIEGDTKTDYRRIGWTVLPLYGLDQVMRNGSFKLHLYEGSTFDLGLCCMFNGLEGGDVERTLVHSLLYQQCMGSRRKKEKDIERQFKTHHVPSWWTNQCCTTISIEMFRANNESSKIVFRDSKISQGLQHHPHHHHRHRSLSPQVLDILSSRSSSIKMSPMDSKSLWVARNTLTTHPGAFIHCLRCVDWSRYDQVQEMYALLHHWSPLPSSVALNLLGPETADPNVRFKIKIKIVF